MTAEQYLQKNYRAISVVSAACLEMGVSYLDVQGDGRVNGQTAARELIAVVAHEHFGISYPQIAHACGKFSGCRKEPLHSTFIEACKRARRKIAARDELFTQRYHNVCRKLGETPMKFEE